MLMICHQALFKAWRALSGLGNYDVIRPPRAALRLPWAIVARRFAAQRKTRIINPIYFSHFEFHLF
jgi:hypothetical protein